MAIQEREDVVKSIISYFLVVNKRKGSFEALRELVNREAAEMAIRRTSGNVRVEQMHYEAVIFIAEKEKSQAVTDFAIKMCLEIYEMHKDEFVRLSSNDALDTAVKLSYLGASKNVAEKVITAIAENGWYGRIEGFAKNLLSRELKSEEVMMLVEKYVKDKGCRSESQEEELLRMVLTYAPEILEEVQQKIDKFVKEFQKDWY